MNIAIYGCCGRMGKELCKEALVHNELIAAVARPDHPMIGKDIGLLLDITNHDIKITDCIDWSQNIDCVIDFTTTESSIDLAQDLQRRSIPHVIGTTGFTEIQLNLLKKLAEKNKIFLSYNMSIGVNILLKAVETIANLANANCDIVISESHHKNKKDMPSGTAIMINEVINKSIENEAIITSVRAGNIIGDHNVQFVYADEIIEISHYALNRSIFAKGAINAARWLIRQNYGLYNMEDLLISKNNIN